MIVVALDLGKTTGIAIGNTKDPFVSRSINYDFSVKGKFLGESFDSFTYSLMGIIDNIQKTKKENIVIVCEKPNSRMPSWHGLRIHFGMFGIVQLMEGIYNSKVSVTTVPALTVKKFWTGTGLADKEFMVDQAKLIYPDVEDDNEADAIAIWHWAQENLYGGYNADK